MFRLINASTLILLGGQAIAELQNGLAFGEFPNERRRMESLRRRSCLTDLRPCPVPLLVGISIRPEGGRSKTGRQMFTRGGMRNSGRLACRQTTTLTSA